MRLMRIDLISISQAASKVDEQRVEHVIDWSPAVKSLFDINKGHLNEVPHFDFGQGLHVQTLYTNAQFSNVYFKPHPLAISTLFTGFSSN